MKYVWSLFAWLHVCFVVFPYWTMEENHSNEMIVDSRFLLQPRFLWQKNTSKYRPSACHRTVSGQCRPAGEQISSCESNPLIWSESAAWRWSSTYLSKSHAQHDQDTGAGPERDPPQVVFQKVPVSCLKSSQHRLHLLAALQTSVERIHGILRREQVGFYLYVTNGKRTKRWRRKGSGAPSCL